MTSVRSNASITSGLGGRILYQSNTVGPLIVRSCRYALRILSAKLTLPICPRTDKTSLTLPSIVDKNPGDQEIVWETSTRELKSYQPKWSEDDKREAKGFITDIEKRLQIQGRILSRSWIALLEDDQNRRDLPRDNPLVSVEVLRYDMEKGVKVWNKGRKCGLRWAAKYWINKRFSSHEVSVSTEGVEELKRIVKIKGVKKEALLSLRQKPGYRKDGDGDGNSQFLRCQVRRIQTNIKVNEYGPRDSVQSLTLVVLKRRKNMKARENNVDAPINEDWVSDDEDDVEPIPKSNSLLMIKAFVDCGCSKHVEAEVLVQLLFKTGKSSIDFAGIQGVSESRHIFYHLKSKIGFCNAFGRMLPILVMLHQELPVLVTGSREVSTALPEVNTATPEDLVGPSPASEDSHVEDQEIELGNIPQSYAVPTTPHTRIHKDHPIEHVIGDVQSSVQTRRMKTSYSEKGFLSAIYEGKTHQDLHTCLFVCFLSQEEPKRVSQALRDPAWVEAMQEELL
ncbi:hypothetical protein Tco_1292283 [Tanacetum coccineum]